MTNENKSETNISNNDKSDFNRDYWNNIIGDRNSVIQEYDKLVIALSGGAIGITFAISGNTGLGFLYYPCFLWALSLIIMLSAYMISMFYHILNVSYYKKNNAPINPEGFLSYAPIFLTYLSGLFFIAGVGAMVYFLPTC